jgi:hypothetical protein
MYPEVHHLDFWEEAVGNLKKLEVNNGVLFAQISKVSLMLPLEMEEKMRPYVGKRISILHAEPPSRSYLLRVFPDQLLNYQGGS